MTPLARARPHPTTRGLQWAALISAGAHLLAVGALLLRLGLPDGTPSPPPQLAQIELIQQPTPTVGDGPTESGQGSESQSDPRQASLPAPPSGQQTTTPLPPQAHGELPIPGPPPAPPPARPAGAAPAVRLGEGGDAGTALVSGSNIIPASPDAKALNRPPAYPDAAARRGEEGTVILRVHIDPDGRPATVDVEESSGYGSLDRAARDAVAHWHFRPAQSSGSKVESDLPVRVRFILKG